MKHLPHRSRIVSCIILATAGLISATVMAAQFSAAPTALSINGVPANQFLGYSMAVSANGQILLVGGPGTGAAGAAFVYTRTNGVWGNPVMLPNSGLSSSDKLGSAVTLSADGTVALVGAPGTGLAYIYTYSGGTWSNPVALPTQGITPVRLGSSAALTPDGKTAFVGDSGASSNLGAVYVYTYNGTSWSNPVALPATGATGNQGLGSAIALSSNDLIALVGASGAGTAWVYTNNGGTWSAPVKLPMTGTPPGGFGGAVALSSNGQTAVVGASFPNSPPLAFVYTNPGTGWSNPTSLTTPTGAPFGNQFVALSPSGNTAFVGVGFTNQHQGAVYAFANTGGNWSIASAVLLSVTGVHPGDSVGSSIVLTADGQELLAGAAGANSNIGAVYDYQSPGSVTLAVTPTPASVIPGHTLTLDLSFNNADTAGGGLPAVTLTNLALTDTLPAGVTYVSSNGANGTCTHSGTTVTCTLTGLPPGTSSQNPWQPSITVSTSSSAGKLTNSVTVSTDEPLTGTSSISTPIINDVTPTVASGSVTTATGTAVSGTLSATPGYSGQTLTFTIVTIPTHGTATLTNASTGAFTYTPASGFTGIDSFVFTAGDGIVTSAPSSEAIAVGTSSSGSSSSSSGKSGGGAFGFSTLLLLSALIAMSLLRKRAMHTQMKVNTHVQLHYLSIASCLLLSGVLSTPAFATVLSNAPIQLSDYGMQQEQGLGWSLALSADGQVAAGGAVAYNRAGTSSTDYTGAAYVYARTGGTWCSPITLSTTGIPTGSFIGSAIAVSPNGQQVIVGAQFATSQGAVYLYDETGSNWTNTPIRTALTLPTSMVGTSFGEGLAISSNGQTLLVGTRPINGSSTGEIYAYSLSGSIWGNPVALPMIGIPNGLDTGYVLAVSANGKVVVAGGPQWNNPNGDQAEGAAYVWIQNTNGTWKNPVQLAYPSTLDSTLSFFGDAVAVSADGTEILVGATGANNTIGATYVYTDSNDTWNSTPKMLSTTMANANSFGSSVALSPDGLTAFMGMPINNTGYVFMSTQTNGTWSTPTALSVANLPVSAFVGEVLAQADNGEELLTTGEDVNNSTGALFVYGSPAAVTLAASPNTPAVAPGSSLTFDLTLTNADQPGSTPATTLNNVVLTDTLPSGVTYVSSDAANGSCNNSGGTVICTLTSLAPGNNSQNPWAPSITVKTPSTAATLINTLNVSANEPPVGTTTISTKVTNDVVPTVKSGNISAATGTAVSGTLNATPGFTGQKLTFAIVSQPSSGNVTLTNASTGAFTYTSNSGFSGIDSFVWTAGDGFVTAAPVSETIAVGSSGSSGSSSSGKSGGGALGFPALLLLGGLLTLTDGRKKGRINRHID